MRRVVITGLGTVNPLGLNVETSFPRLLAGENGVGLITRFDTSERQITVADLTGVAVQDIQIAKMVDRARLDDRQQARTPS